MRKFYVGLLFISLNLVLTIDSPSAAAQVKASAFGQPSANYTIEEQLRFAQASSGAPDNREDSTPHDINTVAFIMPSEWLLMPDPTQSKGELHFRRYGIKFANPDGYIDFDPETFKLQFPDPVGTLINSQVYVCRRGANAKDTLTIHLPDTVTLRSFRLNSWHSRIGVRILADNFSRQVAVEYIKGDLFIDFTDMPPEDFAKLLIASRVIYEFGNMNDRIQFVVQDRFGKANIKGFLREALPDLTRTDPSTIRYFDTAGMLEACRTYTRTGAVPKRSSIR